MDERLANLNEEFLISLYRNICRSLFEKDKMIFSFLLTCKLKSMAGDFEEEELRFFLTGGIQIGKEERESPASWLGDKSWGEIIRMSNLPKFKGFLDHFI